MQCIFVLFNYRGADVEAEERNYVDHHVALATSLPGLRLYTGRLRGHEPAHLRAALLGFDSVEAFRQAYRSPVGRELVRDEQATIRDARIHRLDARVEA